MFVGCNMVFSGLTFLMYFLPIVLGLYFLMPSLKLKNRVLLIASLVFYAWGEPVWVLSMVASAFVNYECARRVEKAETPAKKKLFLLIGVGFSLALLFVFKYMAFFVNSLLGIFSESLTIPVLELPIGISFYTFQILTYTVDVYRGKQSAQNRFDKLLLYVSCFPQLIAGPIVRYGDVAEEISKRSTTANDFAQGMRRFVKGLAKKVLIANVCAEILKAVPLAGSEDFCLTAAWYGAFIYTLQIYFDFSGYSDMAIGLGRVFGFHYLENFDHPYSSLSVREFWRRWHISLGSFFREYVYIPLGGNRGGLKKTIRNTLIVWGLTGLWHGASWTFILWGLYYGAILTVDLLGGRQRFEKLPKVLRALVTFLLVMVGWVIFYYPTLGGVFTHLGAMLCIGVPFLTETAGAAVSTYSLLPLFFFVLSLPVSKYIELFAKKLLGKKGLEIGRAAVYSALLVLSVMFIIGLSSNPFIYFQF